MTVPGVAPDLVGGWQVLLDGPLAGSGHAVLVRDPATVRASSWEREIELQELRLPCDEEPGRVRNVLVLALIERGPGPRPDLPAPELAIVVVPKTEEVRGSAGTTAGQSRLSGLSLGRAGPDLRSVSLIALRVERTPRLDDLVASVGRLAESLDPAADPQGTTAVAGAVLRRVASLASMPGVGVWSLGSVTPSADAILPTQGRGAAEALGLHGPHGRGLAADHMRDGPRTPGSLPGSGAPPGAEKASTPMHPAEPGTAHAEIRVGPRRPSTGPGAALTELRRRQARAALGLDLLTKVPGAAEPWRVQQARMRQDTRARQIVSLAPDDPAAAATVVHTALNNPAPDAFVQGLVERANSTRTCWLIDDALVSADAPRGNDAVEAVEQRLGDLRQQLRRRLEELLGLQAPDMDTDEMYLPTVTPVVVEVADSLVPFVDSAQDQGVFLERLIPAMKARIKNGLGVGLPGLRLRPNPAFAAGHFQVQIDEVPVLDGRLLHDRDYVVTPFADDVLGEGCELTNVHPRSGEPGAWLLTPVEPGQSLGTATDPNTPLTTAEALLHRIEVVLRRHLGRFLGPEEVLALLDEWVVWAPDPNAAEVQGELPASARAQLVHTVVPGRDARVRLTWLLQALLDDGVPVTNLSALLAAVGDVGGLDVPLPGLARAARRALRTELPGPRDPDHVVCLPARCETLLADAPFPDRVAPIDVVEWLRRVVDRVGPFVSVVAATDETRERLAVLGRSEHPFSTTFTAEEMGLEP